MTPSTRDPLVRENRPLAKEQRGYVINNNLKSDSRGSGLLPQLYPALSLHRKLTRHKARYRYRGLNRVGDPGIGSSCCVSALSSRPCQLPWLARFPWLPPIQSRITGGYQVSNASHPAGFLLGLLGLYHFFAFHPSSPLCPLPSPRRRRPVLLVDTRRLAPAERVFLLCCFCLRL